MLVVINHLPQVVFVKAQCCVHFQQNRSSLRLFHRSARRVGRADVVGRLPAALQESLMVTENLPQPDLRPLEIASRLSLHKQQIQHADDIVLRNLRANELGTLNWDAFEDTVKHLRVVHAKSEQQCRQVVFSLDLRDNIVDRDLFAELKWGEAKIFGQRVND